MTCREFVDSLAEYLDAEQSAAMLAECEAHLDECGDCRAFLRNYQATMRLTKSMHQDNGTESTPGAER